MNVLNEAKMNRRKFAFSWGRKLFFGLSWPLSSLLGLIFLQSFVVPQTTFDWIFYVTTYLGHYGILNALVYFILFSPVVALMPGYYISRIWSLILILCLNLFILIDALSFSSYQHHVYGFLSELYLEEGYEYILGANSGIVILSVCLAISALLIWIRGEMIWRSMQGRFSNPVKNWYLIFILICVAISKGVFFYGDTNPKIAALFPLDVQLPKASSVVEDNRKINYPLDSLACTGKNNPNIIFLTIREWRQEDLNPDSMPSVAHMKKHAASFNSHYGVGLNPEDGLFSLMYSIPASYKVAMKDKKSALHDELTRRNYEMIEIGKPSAGGSDEKTMQEFRQWVESRTGEEIQSYFLNISFSQNASEVDKHIQEIVLSLLKEKILSGAYIIMTGGHGGGDKNFIPLLFVSPERKSEDISRATSQYDVVPTLMQRAWGCKKVFNVASIGVPMDKNERDWLLVTGGSNFKIIDYKNNNVTSVFNGTISDTNPGAARHELIFSALKTMNRFSRLR
jgi:membrane-anchored protein YejM (alkaline phosphatase superfamily)